MKTKDIELLLEFKSKLIKLRRLCISAIAVSKSFEAFELLRDLRNDLTADLHRIENSYLLDYYRISDLESVAEVYFERYNSILSL